MKIKLDKQGRPTAIIKLTARQRASIGALLAVMRDMNGEGAILGQVLASGIACKVCSPEETRAIGAVTGCNEGYVRYPEQQL